MCVIVGTAPIIYPIE
uniref:Uncharacterized protein n=1 Tax=Rhizophora mucronata TaxID=61149 RepID=A0A2P2K055_RHIMU